MKRVLILGGSYFLGRVCIEELLQSPGRYEIYALNRGNIPIRKDGVGEIVCDRHDPDRLAAAVPEGPWDAVVDFCAYTEQDISILLAAVPPEKINQYIYISTASVYEQTCILPVSEEGPLLAGPQPELGPAVDYGYNKLLAEYECKLRARGTGMNYTVLRPSFIFGKYNYAPRESYFFDLLYNEQEIIMPKEDLSLFSFVSVWDAAELIVRCCLNPDVFNCTYNVAAPELISYPRLAEELKRLEPGKWRVKKFDLDTILEKGVPLPFPLTEHCIYDGSALAETLNFSYRPFREEFERTYSYYKIGKGWE